MANHEESNPLLGQELAVDNSEKKDTKPSVAPPAVAAAKESSPSPVATGANYGWTADGLPLGHRSVVGEPMPRAKWHSGLCACLGRNDEFCSSDLEVCTSVPTNQVHDTIPDLASHNDIADQVHDTVPDLASHDVTTDENRNLHPVAGDSPAQEEPASSCPMQPSLSNDDQNSDDPNPSITTGRASDNEDRNLPAGGHQMQTRSKSGIFKKKHMGFTASSGILGSVAPCVLYGSNVERLGSSPGSFTNHCLTYSGLYFVGNSLFGWNCLAPWFSSPSRTAIRRKFNLEGSCELFAKPFGGLGSFIGDEEQREHCETTCDSTTHIFCHPCALCQEARELRRRLPHPGFNAQPVFLMMPPGEQTMARGQLQENAI